YIAAAPGNSVPQAWLDVQAERRRQITAEGWTPEHDDEHSHGQMARAAACYALAGSSAPNDGTAALLVSLAWPWDEQWWKPSTPRRDLVKACALALA
ncbi:ead/Ea22-like family protein, partial [Klebsiella pneumoniae]